MINDYINNRDGILLILNGMLNTRALQLNISPAFEEWNTTFFKLCVNLLEDDNN